MALTGPGSYRVAKDPLRPGTHCMLVRARMVLLLTLTNVIPACTEEESPPDDVGCDPVPARTACGSGDRWQCEWGWLHAGHGSDESLSRVLVEPGDDHDALLRQLFPAIGGKPIVSRSIAVPPGLAYDHPMFDRYEITVPVDWDADPYGNNTWRLNFQSFHWFDEYTTGDLDAVEAGAALLVDWVDHALHAEPKLELSWNDHAMVKRLDRGAALLDRYIADMPVLKRRVLDAGAQLVLTHLYGLATDACYSERHNHGMMQDMALLTSAPRYPALRDGAALWDHAQQRMLADQVRKSVTRDGVHIENTGLYHLSYIALLDGAIRVHLESGDDLPTELVDVRDSMFDPLARLLQPDLTFAQFGDETNDDVSVTLAAVLDETRDLGLGDPTLLEPLEWLVTGGERGAPPASLDRVFELGGYATFRDRWGPEATTAHFKAGHHTSAHYHADETAFEIFAHGQALIVEPGSFSYVESDPFWRYQRSPAGQNVLVVDDTGDDGTIARASDRSRVIGHGGDGDVVWVQGSHANFEPLGITSLVRSFVYAKPDTFVVIDHVRARDRHGYAQHFHLHPDLTRIREVAGTTIVADAPDGPSLTITAAVAPSAIETPIGVEDGEVMKGWYFPGFLTRVPAYDIVFRQRGRSVDLPVVIVVTPPGEPARIPTAVEYRERGGVATVSWRLDGVEHAIEVPLP